MRRQTWTHNHNDNSLVFVKILVLMRYLLHQNPQNESSLSTFFSAAPNVPAVFPVQNIVGYKYVSQLETEILRRINVAYDFTTSNWDITAKF